MAYLLPDPGIPVGGTKGASVHVSSLCSAMVKHGAKVTLFAPKRTGPSPEGVSVIDIDVGPMKSGLDGEKLRIDAMARYYQQVEEHLRLDRPDIIHERLSLFAHGGSLSEKLGIARIVEVNAPVANERSTHFGLHYQDEAHRCELLALKDARVVAVSKPLVNWSMSHGARSALSIPNGANTQYLNPDNWKEKRIRIREELGMSSVVVISFVGSLKPWHGLEILLDAVSIAGIELPIGLLIVGDGPLRQTICEMGAKLPELVRFASIGAVAQNEVAQYLAASDISVAPFLPADPFYFSPLKVAEAMAAGLPIVASDFQSIRELLGKSGILVPPGDTKALAQALLDLIKDPLKRKMLSNLALERAHETLDWKSVAKSVLAEAQIAIKENANNPNGDI